MCKLPSIQSRLISNYFIITLSINSVLVWLMCPSGLVTTMNFLFSPTPYIPSSLYVAIHSSLKRSGWLARNTLLNLLPESERALKKRSIRLQKYYEGENF